MSTGSAATSTFGVVAHEMLAGEHPFAHRYSMHALVAAHLTAAPRTLETRRTVGAAERGHGAPYPPLWRVRATIILPTRHGAPTRADDKKTNISHCAPVLAHARRPGQRRQCAGYRHQGGPAHRSGVGNDRHEPGHSRGEREVHGNGVQRHHSRGRGSHRSHGAHRDAGAGGRTQPPGAHLQGSAGA